MRTVGGWCLFGGVLVVVVVVVAVEKWRLKWGVWMRRGRFSGACLIGVGGFGRVVIKERRERCGY